MIVKVAKIIFINLGFSNNLNYFLSKTSEYDKRESKIP